LLGNNLYSIFNDFLKKKTDLSDQITWTCWLQLLKSTGGVFQGAQGVVNTKVARTRVVQRSTRFTATIAVKVPT
jgi:hypothetical protein